MSTRSVGSASGISYNASVSQSVTNERDLLERMVQERDEKITSLQKTINIQKEHTTKLQHTLNCSRLRLKQDQTRGKIQLDSIAYERDLSQSQLHALTQEREKYRDTVFTLHPQSPERGKNPQSPASPRSTTTQLDQFNNISRAGIGGSNKPLSSEALQPGQSQPHIPARTESAHALYLQSQLYQAMHSISAFQIQTKALKQNCDIVIKSLEEDLTETTDLKHQLEVELMSQLTLIEREKGVMEGLLKEKIRIRDDKLKTYEAKIRSLEGLEEDSSDSDDDSMQGRGHSTMSLTTVDEPENESEDEDGDECSVEESVGHEQMESALQELELMSGSVNKQRITKHMQS